MNNTEKEVIKKLLKLYPDVIESLGGYAVVNSDSKIERIGSYIDKHKWFVNEKLPFIVTMDQAFFSWHQNVFIPQSNAMDQININNILNQFSKYELFKMVSDEYYFLNEDNQYIYYDKACLEVIKRESKSYLSKKIAQIKTKKVS